MDEAVDAIFRACAAHCAANHDAVLDSRDPEGVHQFRVALRRLRSALVVFKSVLPADDAAWLEGEASELIDLLGPARDWDVFITETLAAVRAARPDDEVLPALDAAAEVERRRAYERAEVLRAPDYTSFLLSFGRWIETAGWRSRDKRAVLDRPLARMAGRLLDKRHRRLLKRGRDFEGLSDKHLHRLRITLKKLRYAGEFFASQFPEGNPRPYIKALRRLQDDLGRLNDAAVAERLLNGLLAARGGSGDHAAISMGARAGDRLACPALRGGASPGRRGLARLRRRQALLARLRAGDRPSPLRPTATRRGGGACARRLAGAHRMTGVEDGACRPQARECRSRHRLVRHPPAQSVQNE